MPRNKAITVEPQETIFLKFGSDNQDTDRPKKYEMPANILYWALTGFICNPSYQYKDIPLAFKIYFPL